MHCDEEGVSDSRWRIGRTNAAVLPVPVCAPGEDVATLERARDDLDLHGRGLRVLLLEHRADERRREAERRERRRSDGLLDLGSHGRGARRLYARRLLRALRALRTGMAAAASGARGKTMMGTMKIQKPQTFAAVLPEVHTDLTIPRCRGLGRARRGPIGRVITLHRQAPSSRRRTTDRAARGLARFVTASASTLYGHSAQGGVRPR